jgi:ABC-type multidrug transport system fused ATPase/permease subunit
MEDFLEILKRKPAHEDGTEELRIVPLNADAERPGQCVSRTASSSSSQGTMGTAVSAVVLEAHRKDHPACAGITDAENDVLAVGHENAAHSDDGLDTALSTSGRLHDGVEACDRNGGAGSNGSWSWNRADGDWGYYSDDTGALESGLLSRAGQGLSIELRDVQFSYEEARPILRGVSFTVAPGESVAIVGPSGSGKSTILKHLTLLHQPTSGTILVNGQDITTLTYASLRQHIAVVPQDTVLLNDTILENIRYGRPDASDKEVRAASQLAQLDAAMERMPEGYKTAVGERGLKLSGGEKQRVAIARAFLRSPLLLICDEATSALDTAMEQGILRSLAELARGRTSVFVAHRLSTVMNCDKIVVLMDGVVAEMGTHEELMDNGGVYAAMWAIQAGKEDLRESLELWQAAERGAEKRAVSV